MYTKSAYFNAIHRFTIEVFNKYRIVRAHNVRNDPSLQEYKTDVMMRDGEESKEEADLK